ncbi:MAG: hypothetical protein MUE73_06770 [Planctomycetes bacterium]|nr:hypothetical protein [Planctomycetota bacterium]
MTSVEDEPLSPLDAEIELLLGRLAALETREATPEEAPIRQVAIDAIRERLRQLARRCTDKTCRVRIVSDARKAAGEE